MGLFKKKNKDLDPTQALPEEDTIVENSEDRSAYNCSSCNGEGLIWHDGANRHERCPACAGTGKVN